nr:hypothetical protein [uncultured Desulfobacter sp.]
MGKKRNACKACKNKKAHLRESSGASKAFVCKKCGASTKKAKLLCKPVKHKLTHSCEKCNRLSDRPKQLCKPKAIV